MTLSWPRDPGSSPVFLGFHKCVPGSSKEARKTYVLLDRKAPVLSIKCWQLTSPVPFLRSSGSPPQHYHQAPGTLYSLLGWQQDNGPLGPSETNRPCWAGGGGAILRPRELNTASVPFGQARSGQDGGGGRGAHWPWRQGPGQAAGLTWRVLRAGAAAAAAAGRGPWTRPASAPGPGECAPPPSERHGGGGGRGQPLPPGAQGEQGQGMSGGLALTLAMPCLSLLPERPAYTTPVAKLGSIDRACPVRDVEMLQSCFTDTLSYKLWLVACPALGAPSPLTPRNP